jgi:uncharacterized phiE125 gp8 family phage protein
MGQPIRHFLEEQDTMPSILTTPPAVEPVTLAEAKAHLRIVHADEDDLIARLITAARRHLEQQTGLCLVSQGWTCFRDAWPEVSAVELPLAPVIAVTAVTVHGEDDAAAAVDPAHYYLDQVSRPARLMLRQGRLWPRPGRTLNGIEIAVTAGFGAAGSDVPEPLRQALLQLMTHWYGHRGEAAAPLPLDLSSLIAGFREVRL